MKKKIPKGYRTATFAGGCFWCIEDAFDALPGIEAVSGYAGGDEKDPSYRDVASGRTSHVEAVQVYYDPKLYSYEQLLKTFWHQIDPTDEGGQFADRGQQYETAIFYHDDEQKKAAEKSRNEISHEFKEPIATKILPYTTFFPAEDYHQGYSKKHKIHYNMYKRGSGRDRFIKETWGEMK